MADYTWQPIISGGIDTGAFINQYQTQSMQILGLTQNIQVILLFLFIGLITLIIIKFLYGIIAPFLK